jgi:hypothetical protein
MVRWGIEGMGLEYQSPQLKLFYFKEYFDNISQSIDWIEC